MAAVKVTKEDNSLFSSLLIFYASSSMVSAVTSSPESTAACSSQDDALVCLPVGYVSNLIGGDDTDHGAVFRDQVGNLGIFDQLCHPRIIDVRNMAVTAVNVYQYQSSQRFLALGALVAQSSFRVTRVRARIRTLLFGAFSYIALSV